MKKRTFLLNILFLLTLGASIINSFSNDLVNQGIVYYFGFEIERITGIPEHQIEQYGCLFKINRIDFEQSLITDSEAIKDLSYNKLDIRAKVSFGKEIYFIDYAGVVFSSNNKILLLDKDKFVSKLVETHECFIRKEK